jgi:hypothetical protein
VFASPATVRRVVEKHDIRLPGEPTRSRPPAPKLPQVPWVRHRIWMGDASHFTRARRVAFELTRPKVRRALKGFFVAAVKSRSGAAGIWA